jgi:hypothetical protein
MLQIKWYTDNGPSDQSLHGLLFHSYLMYSYPRSSPIVALQCGVKHIYVLYVLWIADGQLCKCAKEHVQ